MIAAAYGVLAARLDPARDATGVDEIRLAELKRAHATLIDPGRRRVYDIERDQLIAMGPGPEDDDAAGRPDSLNARINGSEPGHVVGDTRLNFGRYTGQTLREIAEQDGDYLRWLSRHSSGLRFRHEIERLLRGETAAR